MSLKVSIRNDGGIGGELKRLRATAGLTQKQLATKVGLSEIAIRQYETNKRLPKWENMIAIFAALGKDKRYIVKHYLESYFDVVLGNMADEDRNDANDEMQLQVFSVLLDSLDEDSGIIQSYSRLSKENQQTVRDLIEFLKQREKEGEGNAAQD